MSRGDHLYVWRGFYNHHGIAVDGDEVIHFCGEPGGTGEKGRAVICRTSLEDFANGREVKVREYGERLDADETVARAESRLGEGQYDVLGKNCEHFAFSCATGRSKSAQVNAVATGGSLVGLSYAAGSGGLGLVASVGAVAGTSGPGIMSGLAYVGGFMGGGAVAGVVAIGAVPGAISVAVMCKGLGSDPALTESEQVARRVGRKASAVGATAGSVGAVYAISALGVQGLGAAGITSGLAAIGATVGGGMAVGTAIAVAAPAALAGALGYGVYRFIRWLGGFSAPAIAGATSGGALSLPAPSP